VCLHSEQPTHRKPYSLNNSVFSTFRSKYGKLYKITFCKYKTFTVIDEIRGLLIQQFIKTINFWGEEFARFWFDAHSPLGYPVMCFCRYLPSVGLHVGPAKREMGKRTSNVILVLIYYSSRKRDCTPKNALTGRTNCLNRWIQCPKLIDVRRRLQYFASF
jgi:hypothetical protein